MHGGKPREAETTGPPPRSMVSSTGACAWLPLVLLLLGAAVPVRSSSVSSAGPRSRPAPIPPSVGAVQSGTYRNMFLEAGYTQAAIDAKIDAAWQQLYFGARAGCCLCTPDVMSTVDAECLTGYAAIR